MPDPRSGPRSSPQTRTPPAAENAPVQQVAHSPKPHSRCSISLSRACSTTHRFSFPHIARTTTIANFQTFADNLPTLIMTGPRRDLARDLKVSHATAVVVG